MPVGNPYNKRASRASAERRDATRDSRANLCLTPVQAGRGCPILRQSGLVDQRSYI